MTFFTASLYLSLTIFTFGLLYKVSTWFRYNIGLEGSEIPVSTRVATAARGIVSALFSSKVLTLLKVFILDGLFQARTLREDGFRWFMHLCIYGGFMVLLLMHALSKFTTAILFSDYYSTVNPFLFLRDLAGILVIVGVLLAVYRRFGRKGWRPATNAMDLYAVLILAVIMISGLVLQGTKIVSQTIFQNMVEEYLIQPDAEQVRALSSYWVQDFGLVSPSLTGPFDAKVLDQGRTVHEMSCMQCHSRPQWAPASYAVSRLMAPLAEALDRANVPSVLWQLHFLACFVGLAYLPFSKMFHIFASPLSLMANAVMERGVSAPANLATKQILELDACTHCGACTRRCSVAVAFREIPNVNILPSEKIASLKALAAGKNLSSRELRTIQQGLFLCTNCNRCTMVCPVGINLRDLWFSVREALLQKVFARVALALTRFPLPRVEAGRPRPRPVSGASYPGQGDLCRQWRLQGRPRSVRSFCAWRDRSVRHPACLDPGKFFLPLLWLYDLLQCLPSGAQLPETRGGAWAPAAPAHACHQLQAVGPGIQFDDVMGLSRLLPVPGELSAKRAGCRYPL